MLGVMEVRAHWQLVLPHQLVYASPHVKHRQGTQSSPTEQRRGLGGHKASLTEDKKKKQSVSRELIWSAKYGKGGATVLPCWINTLGLPGI